MAKLDIVNANNVIESNPQRAYFKLKNTGGPKGDKGDTGERGPQGATGPQGPAGLSASVKVGSTTTLNPGADATVTNSGDSHNVVLDFGIPTGAQGPKGDTGSQGPRGPQGFQGPKGDTGAAATVRVGNTNTGAPGTNAQVTNAGNEHFAVFNFTIPRGDKGETGSTGAQGPQGPKGDTGAAGQAATITVGSTTTTNPGTSATVTNTGTTSAAVLNFGIPRGATGSVKSDVVSELPETGEEDTFYLVNREATEQTASGKAINFTNSDNSGDITDFQLDGETSQNGTPTPSAPVPVQTVTGENVVKIAGKNLLPNKMTSGTIAGAVQNTVNSDGSFTLNGTATSGANVDYNHEVGYYVHLEQGKTYTLSVNNAGIYWRLRKVSANTNIAQIDSPATSATFTANTTEDAFVYFVILNNSSFSSTNYKVQLELGSATTYEPYQSHSYEVNLGNTELCKIGDYQDYIYKSGEKWYKHSECGGASLSDYANTASRLTTNTSGKYRFRLVVPGVLPAATTGTVVPSYCSHLDTGTVGNTYSMAKQCIAIDVGTNNYVFIYATDTESMSVDDFKTWLTGKNMSFYYALATPTDTEITNEVLIAQLDNVASAPLYTGVNNITTITPNEQGTLEIKYVTYDKYNQNKVYIWNDTLQQWQIIVP